MHPAEEIFCEKSNKLRGKTVVMGITGSIAATECFATARELVRHGAKVIPVMTEAATDLVTPESLEFATGNQAITKLTGKTEHIDLMGNGGKADLLLIYPCTANTISKMANGIDDTPVTSMATVAFGNKIPIIVAPAMHNAMYENPAVKKNVKTIQSMGAEVVGPFIEKGRAKVASRDLVVKTVIRHLSKNDLKGLKILVIGGRSEEAIDSMRIITNKSTGMMAYNISESAFERGAETELWMGSCDIELPEGFNIKRFKSVSDLEKMIPKINHDFVIVPAALSDFAPADTKKGKIDSEKTFSMKLDSVPKMLPLISKKCSKVIGFKAESGKSEKDLIDKARKRLKEYGLLAIVANDVSVVGMNDANAILVTENSEKNISGTKANVAEAILDFCQRKR